MTERDEQGKFIKNELGLHPQTIGVRIHRKYYAQFKELAAKKNMRPTELARFVIETYIQNEEKIKD